MIFEIPQCPECGEDITGTLENVPGTALIFRNEDGEYEYEGETKMFWDGLETIEDEAVRVPAVCAAGHEWQTKMEDA